MVKENFIANTLSQCIVLNDSLEILLENKWAVQSLKQKTNNLNKELTKTVDQILSKVGDPSTINKTVDQDVEIMRLLSKMDINEKQSIIDRIKSEAKRV